MKICFFVDSIFSYGGVQRITAVIARYFAKEHEVTILTLDDPLSEDTTLYELNTVNIKFEYFSYPEIPKHVNVWNKIYSGLYKFFKPSNRWMSDLYGVSSFSKRKQQVLIEVLNRKDYDVIIGVHAFLSLRLASIRTQLTCPRVIGWMHNSYQALFEMKDPYLPNLKHHFAHHMKYLDDIVVLCKNDQVLFKKYLDLHVEYIYNPVTLQPGDVANVANKRFLTVGRLTPVMKGFDVLIKAFSIFAQNNHDWTLEIVGEGPDEDNVKKWIDESGVAHRIILSPFTKDIQKHYSGASVYILPSRWEGMPLVLMEALSHGLPVICSDLPVCEELLGNTSYTKIFPTANVSLLAEAMKYMANADLGSMQGECLNKAMEFSLDNIAKKWIKVLTIK